MNPFDDPAIREAVTLFGFSLPRLLTAFMMLPVFASAVMSGLVRNGVAASLALFVWPIIAVDAPTVPLDMLTASALLLKEVMIGFLIGFGAAVLFWAMESAGYFIDNQRGATMASSIDPLTGSQTSPFGVLFVQAITVIFFVGGGFIVLLGALYGSYQLWPVFSFLPSMGPEAIPYFLSVADRILALAVLFAAPVIIAMFLSELALGLISRFAPQLNVFFLAMPVKSAVGLLILILYVGVMLSDFGALFQDVPTHFSILGQLFNG